MPHKKTVSMPAWVQELAEDDLCLYTTVVEAIVARSFAVTCGASKKALRAADLTLDQIADGRVWGAVAWKKAADALRKYTQAAEQTQE